MVNNNTTLIDRLWARIRVWLIERRYRKAGVPTLVEFYAAQRGER